MYGFEFRSRLRRLTELAPQLNKTTDEVNLAIKGVEEFMKNLGLGIATEVPVDSEHRMQTDGNGQQRSFEEFRNLAFERYGQHSVFRIVVKRGVRQEIDGKTGEEFRSSTPLAECNRQEKLRAMVAVLPLLEAVLKRAEAIDNDAKEAAKSVQEVLSALSAVPTLSEVLASTPRPGSFLDVAQHTPGATGEPITGGVAGRLDREAMSALLDPNVSRPMPTLPNRRIDSLIRDLPKK